jgi:hypothetical protein
MCQRCAVLLYFPVSTCAFAGTKKPQAPPSNVTVGDLIKNAHSYEGHLVHLRGHVNLAFEDFTIEDSTCGIDFSTPKTAELPIWLAYGGDEQDPAVYCCGSPVVSTEPI